MVFVGKNWVVKRYDTESVMENIENIKVVSLQWKKFIKWMESNHHDVLNRFGV